MPTIDIIIPAYNEEQRIGPMLQSYANFFRGRARICVVLNGCTDHTDDRVKDSQKKFPETIAYQNIGTTLGKGSAIIHGWTMSHADIVGFVDADGATTPQEFQKLLDAFTDDVDGVIASRFITGATIIERQSVIRTMMSHAFIFIVRHAFHLPFHDTQCGAKIFRRNIVMPILPFIQERQLVFDVELLWRLHLTHANIREVPTYWVDQPGSAALGTYRKFLHEAWNMFSALIRLKMQKHLLSGRQ